MSFKNIKTNMMNFLFILIYQNFFYFVNSYDSSLLKVNYFFDANNLCYINALSNSKGDLYFEYFGNSDTIRYFYGLNSFTGKEILFNNDKVLKINFDYKSMHHESKIINYQNNENYIFTYNPEYCEFIDINNPNKFSYKKSENFIYNNGLDKASYRNKIITLSDNNYLLTIIGKKIESLFHSGSYLYIYTFNFISDNIEGFSKIKGDSKGISIDFFNTTECFQTEKQYLECIINEKSNFFTNKIKIFIYDLDFNELTHNEISEIEESTFIKIIYLKNEIGAYIYFDKNTPLLQIKYLENNILNYQFGNSPIKLDGNGAYSLSNDIFLSDGIKINKNKFTTIFTSQDLKHILVCLFEMYNNDQSYYLQYFYLDLNEINAKIELNIKTFLFRDHFGIALYDSINKYPGFLIFSYPNLNQKLMKIRLILIHYQKI